MTRPNLHVINSDTGEVVEDERDLLIDQLTRDLHGKQVQLAKARKELASIRLVEPEAQTILDILEHWRERCKPRADLAVGGKRWEKVHARLREQLVGRPPLTPDELKLATDGALLDRWHTQKGMAHRLDAEFLFRSSESVERLRDLAIGFQATAGASVGDLIEVGADLRGVPWKQLLQVCMCSHHLIAHTVPDPNRHGFAPCFMCDCEDFDYDPFDSFNMRTNPTNKALWERYGKGAA